MTQRNILVLFSCLEFAKAFTQVAPSIAWQKCLGGSSYDRAESIEQTADGGYVLAGYTLSSDGDVVGQHGDEDGWIAKLDGLGTLVWQRALGGSLADQAMDVEQTSDGGYIVAGSTASNDGDVTGQHGVVDAWVVKLDPSGALEWQKALGGSEADWAISIQQTDDGGYVFAGATISNDGDVTNNHGTADFWVVKLDDIGTLLWQRTFGGTIGEWARSILQCADGGYIVVGNTISNDGDVTGNHGDDDSWVVKLDATGALVWQVALGGTDEEWALSVDTVSGGGYVVGGYSQSDDGDVSGNHGAADLWVTGIDDNGVLLWQRALGGSQPDWGSCVRSLSADRYVVVGHAASTGGDVSGNHGMYDLWLAQLDTTGTLIWQKAMGGGDGDIPRSLEETSDGGFILAGWSSSNAGDVSGNHGLEDIWVVKLGSPTSGIEDPTSQDIALFPNPASNHVFVRTQRGIGNTMLTLTDAMGREVVRTHMTGPTFDLDLGNAPSGLYLVTVYDQRGTASQRLEVE
ncbi:MAG: T9SS type A sorting domain-containing protein [Flavobacteriales bacterium]